MSLKSAKNIGVEVFQSLGLKLNSRRLDFFSSDVLQIVIKQEQHVLSDVGGSGCSPSRLTSVGYQLEF